MSFNTGNGSIALATRSLRYLTISHNNFNSTLSFLRSFPVLVSFDGSGNRFHGPVPPASDVLSIAAFICERCGLVGPIPSAWSTLPQLQNVDLAYNQITAPLPPFLKIIQLNLAHNRLSGGFNEVISPLWRYTGDPGRANSLIQHLDLSWNNISLEIDSNVWLCSGGAVSTTLFCGIRTLSFAGNPLVGPAPMMFLSSLMPLAMIDLSFTQLSGRIPTEWGLFSYLKVASRPCT